MNKKEVAALMKLIINCYQNFDVTEDKVNVWTVLLADIDFNKAQQNLMTHIKSSSYAPTPADIIKQDHDVWIDYDKQRLETQVRLAAIEQRSTPLVSDEERAEIRRRAQAGEYDEKYKYGNEE